MKRNGIIWKRGMAVILAISVVLQMLPVDVFAEELTGNIKLQKSNDMESTLYIAEQNEIVQEEPFVGDTVLRFGDDKETEYQDSIKVDSLQKVSGTDNELFEYS